ncbi:hypothetical protein ACFSC4_27000 [Deinococcus malanensis]|uniref:hypothetical protein n=1 Tax=Deinococcus malanensis TaxID=1706855 RepID=UPI00364258C7
MLLTLFEAQSAAADPAAELTLDQAKAWLMRTAGEQVPAELKDTFLTRSSVARRILTARECRALEGKNYYTGECLILRHPGAWRSWGRPVWFRLRVEQ